MAKQYQTKEEIVNDRGENMEWPIGTKVVICSKWYSGKNGKFAMVKAPSVNKKTCWTDETHLERV